MRDERAEDDQVAAQVLGCSERLSRIVLPPTLYGVNGAEAPRVGSWAMKWAPSTGVKSESEAALGTTMSLSVSAASPIMRARASMRLGKIIKGRRR